MCVRLLSFLVEKSPSIYTQGDVVVINCFDRGEAYDLCELIRRAVEDFEDGVAAEAAMADYKKTGRAISIDDAIARLSEDEQREIAELRDRMIAGEEIDFSDIPEIEELRPGRPRRDVSGKLLHEEKIRPIPATLSGEGTDGTEDLTYVLSENP
jgi:hypothetical protein